MAKILIKDTTVSERAQIVREALGADSDCEGIDLTVEPITFTQPIITPSRRSILAPHTWHSAGWEQEGFMCRNRIL